MSTPNFKWRKIDEIHSPSHLSPDDICYYAREHFPGGYSGQGSNQLLFNFKKPPKYRDDPSQWHYKTSAINRFAAELNVLKFRRGSIFIPAATSKPRGSSNHDSRLDDTLSRLKDLRKDIVVLPILDVVKSVPSAHSDGGSRDPVVIQQNLTLTSTPRIDAKYVFIVDDIITSGGHYVACRKILQDAYPEVIFVGLFWALHIS